jgi:acetyltransferase-like isoleucine patch superfamily enzyme
MKALKSEVFSRAVQTLVGGPLFDAPGLNRLRSAGFRLFAEVGDNCLFSQHIRLNRQHSIMDGRLVIGNNVQIAAYVELDYTGGLTIEDDVWISRGAVIETHTHIITSRALKKTQAVEARPMVLRRDSWIGAQAFISSSVEYIGEGAIIGAGSVVTKNIPDWAIAVGSPARVIKYRGEGERTGKADALP